MLWAVPGTHLGSGWRAEWQEPYGTDLESQVHSEHLDGLCQICHQRFLLNPQNRSFVFLTAVAFQFIFS